METIVNAKILCVDDEKNVLKALQRLFLDENYELLIAESGDAGLEILEENPEIQVVISDYRMPGMNGVDFLKEVYQRQPDTIRIVLSGYADAAAVVAAINEGKIYRFVPKPWNDDELHVTISKALETYALQRQNKMLLTEQKKMNQELNQFNVSLETLVSKRTAALVFQNKALASAQNILHVLPVGVIGVDISGMVVQCNGAALKLLGREEIGIGCQMEDVLPPELVNLVETLAGTQQEAESLVCHVSGVRARAVQMNTPDQKGTILVLDHP